MTIKDSEFLGLFKFLNLKCTIFYRYILFVFDLYVFELGNIWVVWVFFSSSLAFK